MDDLTAKVQEILGSEDGMRQLQEMAQMFGLTASPAGSAPESAPAPGGGPDITAMPADTGGSQDSRQEEPAFPISPADLMRIGSMMQNMRDDSPAAALLKALRPLLREERQKKVDQAVKMLRLFSLLPLLQESGLLKGFLG